MLTDDEKALIAKFKAISENDRVDNALAQKSSKTLSTQASWSNREEEWYFVNKRLLFATQSSHAAETWMQNLNQLLEQLKPQSKQPLYGVRSANSSENNQVLSTHQMLPQL